MTHKVAERIASNAVFLLASQLITGFLSFIPIILLPRYYGATGIGAYHLASSLWVITALLIGFGIDVVITKEIARDHNRLSELVSIGLLIRLIFYVVGFIAVAIFTNVMDYATETTYIVYLFGIANLTYQVGHIFSAALYGLDKLKTIATASIITEFVIASGILVLVLSGQSIIAVASISILAGITRTLFFYGILKKQTILHLQLKLHLLPWMLKEGGSILLNRLLRNLYAQADVIIISFFVNETVVGWYSIADVAYGTLLMLPNILATTLFPTFARLSADEPKQLPLLARRALNYVFLFAVPVGFGIVLVAKTAVHFIVGAEFSNSVPIVAGFGIVAIFTSINVFLSQLLIAMNQQNKLSILLGVAIVLTLPIDFLLIPWTQDVLGNGALGGVISYLITELVIMGGSFGALPKRFFTHENLFYALRVLLAGLVMFLLTWPIRGTFILLPILLGAFIYILMAFILKLVGEKEITLARRIIQQGVLRVRRYISVTPSAESQTLEV